MEAVSDAPWVVDYDHYFNMFYQLEEEDDGISAEPDD